MNNPNEINRHISDRVLALGQEVVNQELEKGNLGEDQSLYLAGNILVTVAASLVHPQRLGDLTLSTTESLVFVRHNPGRQRLCQK